MYGCLHRKFTSVECILVLGLMCDDALQELSECDMEPIQSQ
jgi:hypothetical protein